MQWWVAVLVCAAVLQTVLASKVLFMAPICSRSHLNFFMGIVNALADDDNQVTVVSPYKSSKERNNVREVVLTGVDVLDKMPNLFTGNKIFTLSSVFTHMPSLCADALGAKNVQNLLKEDFDLIILSVFMSDCFLAVVHQLKVPFIYVSPAGLMGPRSSMIGNPRFPSYDPSHMLDYKHPLTFRQRAISTLSEAAMDVLLTYAYGRRLEAECRQRGLCPDDMPSLSEIRLNTSLLLLTVYKQSITQLVQLFLPWYIVGAYISVQQNLSHKYRTILVQVFASLKQRVLWKWDKDTMDDLPPNVRLGKWLPQQDILGKENDPI
nr:UDP-glucosyltransferase 2-like [Cherax quadricarinatus]